MRVDLRWSPLPIVKSRSLTRVLSCFPAGREEGVRLPVHKPASCVISAGVGSEWVPSDGLLVHAGEILLCRPEKNWGLGDYFQASTIHSWEYALPTKRGGHTLPCLQQPHSMFSYGPERQSYRASKCLSVAWDHSQSIGLCTFSSLWLHSWNGFSQGLTGDGRGNRHETIQEQ